MVHIQTHCRTYIFHLIPKYVGGPDFGGVFQMNPKKVYLTDEEYADMAEKLKKEL